MMPQRRPWDAPHWPVAFLILVALILLLLPIFALRAQAPAGPIYPGGSGGGGGISSITATSPLTGGTITSSGSIGLPASLTLQPQIYFCATSALSTGVYTCTTGAGLTTSPPSGSLIVIEFGQSCTTYDWGVAIDSLNPKLVLDYSGNPATISTCSDGGISSAILKVHYISSSNFQLFLVGSGFTPVCIGLAGSVQYNNQGSVGCSTVPAYFPSTNSGPYLLADHLKGYSSSLPAIAAGAGAGTSPTVSLSTNSNDLGGQVNITTGTLPSASAVAATITFNVAYTTSPFCVLNPGNSNTALLTGVTMVYPTTTTTTLVINAGTTALTAATAYVWSYHCFQ